VLSGGRERRLLNHEGLEIPTSWSPDGRFILFQTEAPASDISVLSLPDTKVLPFANTKFTEASGQFSRDGRWVAYSSNETGRTEVYIAPFGRTGTRVPVSIDGGSSPRWSEDGKELFYVRGDDMLMRVAVSANESSTEIGPSQALFRTQFRRNAFPYDVCSDGTVPGESIRAGRQSGTDHAGSQLAGSLEVMRINSPKSLIVLRQLAGKHPWNGR
jgi:eukaryotic-like serine/threonine-protein kinase